MNNKEYVQVGDTIISTTCLGENHFLVTRVTKTLAISKRESDGYEHKFKRYISSIMSHPREQWNIARHSVVRAGGEI